MNGTERRAPDRSPSSGLPFPSPGSDTANRPLPDDRAFVQALDLLPYGLAFFDLSGMLLCSNRALRCLLEDASERSRLEQEILRLAQALGEQVRASTGAAGEARTEQVEELTVREVDCFEARYRLRGSRVSIDLFGLGTTLLITFEPAHSLSQSDKALRERFGFTRAEARVARLLAEGRSNQGIAAELRISTHTARHHTQRVLQKLGVRSRAEVGQRLHRLETDRSER